MRRPAVGCDRHAPEVLVRLARWRGNRTTLWWQFGGYGASSEASFTLLSNAQAAISGSLSTISRTRGFAEDRRRSAMIAAFDSTVEGLPPAACSRRIRTRARLNS